MKDFSIIVAVADNGVIGDSENNVMPWHIPEDLKWFKEKTSGKTVVMGSRTYESIGRPLPNRKNVVITRNLNGEWVWLQKDGIEHSYGSFQEAYENLEPGFFVIGGEKIYKQALLAKPKSLYITRIYEDFEGDVTFPIFGRLLNSSHFEYMGAKYNVVFSSDLKEKEGLKYQFFCFERE